VLGAGIASISVEVPFVFNWDEELRSDAVEIPKSLKMYFLTPSARLNIFSESAVSPWVSFGGGFGHFSGGSTLSGVPTDSTTTGALQAGVGLDVRVFHSFSVRGEARDFWSGVPQLNVDTGQEPPAQLFCGRRDSLAFLSALKTAHIQITSRYLRRYLDPSTEPRDVRALLRDELIATATVMGQRKMEFIGGPEGVKFAHSWANDSRRFVQCSSVEMTFK
jgi:hypothetical protein